MAGFSCALECYDIQLDTVVLEMQAEVGGQIKEIPFHVRNVAAGVYDDEHSLPVALQRSVAILGGPGAPVRGPSTESTSASGALSRPADG